MEHSMMSGNVDFKSPCAESMGLLACYYDTAGNRTSNTEVRGNWRAGNAKTALAASRGIKILLPFQA
jgi:hypothetical protein